MEDDALAADPIFLAVTRPALWRGVPIEAVAVNAMATTMVFVALADPLWLSTGLALHGALRLLVARDPNALRAVRLWAETKGRARDQAYWGGSSVAPLRVRRPRRAHEIRVHA